jgi:hypothetical protein
MAQLSGVEEAIRELEREEQNLSAVIKLLKKIQETRGNLSGTKVEKTVKTRKTRKLSPTARKRISEAAKKRWAAYRKTKAA